MRFLEASKNGSFFSGLRVKSDLRHSPHGPAPWGLTHHGISSGCALRHPFLLAGGALQSIEWHPGPSALLCFFAAPPYASKLATAGHQKSTAADAAMPFLFAVSEGFVNEVQSRAGTLVLMISIAYFCSRSQAATLKIGPLLGHDLTKMRYED